MFSIFTYIRNLLPSFKRDAVQEKLRLVVDTIVETTRPVFDKSKDFLDERTVKSQTVKKFLDFFARQVGRFGKPENSYQTCVTQVLSNIEQLADLLDTALTKRVGQDVAAEGLTFQSAALLRLIELADFTVNYARQHMLYLVTCESNAVFGKQPGRERPPAELKYLEENLLAYLRCLNLFLTKPTDIIKQLDSIPELAISSMDGQTGTDALQGAKVDPLQMNAIPVVSHIFYWVGIRVNNYQVARYNRALEERRALEMRLELLRQKRAGGNDAGLEVIIGNYESQIQVLSQEIARMEK